MENKRYFDQLGVMLDCSRNAVCKKETLYRFIDIIADMGYNLLQLYMEDTYEISGEPYFGYLRGRYTARELKDIDAYAKKKGIELVPCIQTLAHLGGMARWDHYSAEYIDTADILLVGEDRVYELIDKMFSSVSECFSSRKINIGMDEAQMVGLGKYLAKNGYRNRFDILTEHLRRVSEIAKKYDLRPMMWSDMFFRLGNNGDYYSENPNIDEDVIRSVPENVELVYWDYYHTEKSFYDKMIKAHAKTGKNLWFAAGIWSWLGFVPHYEFAYDTMRAGLQSCIDNGVRNVLITVWKDDGAESSLFSSLPALMYAAECAKGNFSVELLKKPFESLIGIKYEDFVCMEQPDNVLEKNTNQNPSKLALYSDPFYGVFDYSLNTDLQERFQALEKRLSECGKGSEFEYVFRTLSCLCGVLSLKYGLGIKTRNLYKKQDKTALRTLAEKEYRIVLEKLRAFYDAFEFQWRKENKLNGFETHDIRLGGLLKRTEHCQKIILEYCSGKIDFIEGLEEEILPFEKNTRKGECSHCLADWRLVAMIKP